MQEDFKYDIVRFTRGVVLSLGAAKLYPHFISVGQDGTDVICANDAIDCTFLPASADAVVLPEGANLSAWWEVLKEGGHLVLQDATDCPHDVEPLHWNLVHRDGSTIVLRKRLTGGRWALPAPIGKRALVIRHGGIGDQLQAAYLLPALKAQGFHITFLTTPSGKVPIEHDPHVDDWFIVDRDQVPNHELVAFWKAIGRHYERVVNLNESVEWSFLAMPGRIAHTWPQPARHWLMDRNYAEFAAQIAQVPFQPGGQFYATAEEETEAKRGLDAIAASIDGPGVAGLGAREPLFFILWALSGSSPHKANPHADRVIGATVQAFRRAVVLLVGDEASKVLAQGLVHPRIVDFCGQLPLRATLAVAQQCDLVIGPETGVMNAVCYAPMPKVLMLSHSSHENLTKHWVNTYHVPGVAPCYPCHQLHITAEHCPRGIWETEEGPQEIQAAACQVNMDPAALFRPVAYEYEAWARVQRLRFSVEAA